MKLTKEMKDVSKAWLDNLINLTEFGKAIPTVPYNYEAGMCFGISEARRLLDVAETPEEWEVEIAKAIAHRKTILRKEVADDQKVVGKAWIMGLRTALSYAGCLELSGGMDC